MSGAGAAEPILQVDRLAWRLPVQQGFLLRQIVGYVQLLDGISFDLYAGETLALVGESGSGKSSLARALVRLEQPSSGQVQYRGQDLLALQGEPLRQARRKLQLIFPDVRGALNPAMRAGEIVAEAFDTLDIPEPALRIANVMRQVGYSPELSACLPGALTDEQCLRLCLARALAAEPEVLIYDAPPHPSGTNSLLQILHQLKELQTRLPLSCLMLQRDPALAFQFASRIGILYAGRLVELAERDELYQRPLHPYTRALLSAMPLFKSRLADKPSLPPGDIPEPGRLPAGCRFHPRCRLAQPVCQEIDPPWVQHAPGHWAACHMV